jgi:hypothetical protein
VHDLGGEVESERVVNGVFCELVEVVKSLDKISFKPLLEDYSR